MSTRRSLQGVGVTVVGMAVTGAVVWAMGVGQASAAGEANALDANLTAYNRVSLGDGFVETLYAKDALQRPRAIAVRVDSRAIASLPTMPRHDGETCFDKDGNGIDLVQDCASGHERELWFPKLAGLPFKWLMFNWQPAGHGPTHVFDKPHFDLHLFIQNRETRNTIRTGPCNLVINCDDQVTATKPVPAPYNPVGWGLPGAAGRMGNHLVDPNAAPANGGPFDQAFAYGTWDGHISFWEPVVNTDWIKAAAAGATFCRPIPQTPQVELTGSYPTRLCSQRQSNGNVVMRLDQFTVRQAPAGAQPPAWMFDSAGGAQGAGATVDHH